MFSICFCASIRLVSKADTEKANPPWIGFFYWPRCLFTAHPFSVRGEDFRPAVFLHVNQLLPEPAVRRRGSLSCFGRVGKRVDDEMSCLVIGRVIDAWNYRSALVAEHAPLAVAPYDNSAMQVISR